MSSTRSKEYWKSEQALKYRHMLKLALIAYVLSFAIGVVVGLLLGFSYEEKDLVSLPDSLWYMGMATTALVTYILTKRYFISGLVRPGAREGLLFGLVMLGVSLVFDALLFIPHILSYGYATLYAYYTHPFFLVTIAILLSVATGVGIMLGKRE